MFFRLSQKLNTKIKGGTLSALSLDENPFADWSAVADHRRQRRLPTKKVRHKKPDDLH
jgi:hypothetical protein